MSDCVITLLPSESCAHCTKAVEVVFDEPHERKDYAQVELTDMMKDEDGRVVYPRQEIPNPDQFTDDVSYYDIYGSSTDVARRLSKKH